MIIQRRIEIIQENPDNQPESGSYGQRSCPDSEMSSPPPDQSNNKSHQWEEKACDIPSDRWFVVRAEILLDQAHAAMRADNRVVGKFIFTMRTDFHRSLRKHTHNGLCHRTVRSCAQLRCLCNSRCIADIRQSPTGIPGHTKRSANNSPTHNVCCSLATFVFYHVRQMFTILPVPTKMYSVYI